MRWLIPVAALAVAGLSIWIDLGQPSPAAAVCRNGLCRFDQMYASVDAAGANPANLKALLEEDPANPSAWCTFAESLAESGNAAAAQAAFAHAVELGPGMAPVLMRAVNFDFSHGQLEDGFARSKRILKQTGAFDEIVFSYLQRSKVPAPEMLEAALPAEQRAASTWLRWLKENGSEQELLDTWQWMKAHRLETQASALEFTWTLWQRGGFSAAQQLWSDWLGAARGDYPNPQRLFNRRFESEPNTSPFDWTLSGTPAVELTRKDGLEIRFAGTENAAFSGVHQFATVSPGRYRFAAEIEARDLTTDQRPLFHIFDVEPHRKVDVASTPVAANAGRSWIAVEFNVPAETQAVEIELERYSSAKYDNKISGTLHVYQASLTRE